MANKYNVWNAFLFLLAFVCGSFFTWMLTLHTLQNCESQRLAEAFKAEDQRDAVGIRHVPKLYRNIITRPRENVIKNDPSPNRTLDHLPTVPTNMSLHDTHAPYNPTQYSSGPIRVLCWIMTSPQNLHDRANNVRETWGPRCDVTLYMSSQTDPDFPAVGLNVREGRDALWNKTRSAILYIYEHHFNNADWFMKADDDTYVVVENLRKFLGDKASSAPVYYGHHFKPYIRQGYMSGGAGYVMSKEALRRIVDELSVNQDCGAGRRMTRAEDVTVGLCMMRAGVVAGDSRDDQNRSRFLPFDVLTFFNNELPEWYFRFSKYPVKKGRGCCSDSLISVHYVTDRAEMLMLDYYIHGLQLKTAR